MFLRIFGIFFTHENPGPVQRSSQRKFCSTQISSIEKKWDKFLMKRAISKAFWVLGSFETYSIKQMQLYLQKHLLGTMFNRF